jgi:hypothetical protein
MLEHSRKYETYNRVVVVTGDSDLLVAFERSDRQTYCCSLKRALSPCLRPYLKMNTGQRDGLYLEDILKRARLQSGITGTAPEPSPERKPAASKKKAAPEQSQPPQDVPVPEEPEWNGVRVKCFAGRQCNKLQENQEHALRFKHPCQQFSSCPLVLGEASTERDAHMALWIHKCPDGCTDTSREHMAHFDHVPVELPLCQVRSCGGDDDHYAGHRHVCRWAIRPAPPPVPP